MKKVALVSLGCAKNLVDSEMMEAVFGQGFELTPDLSEADLIILNTCAFIEAAKKESLGEIRRLVSYKKAKLLVTGCLTQRYKKELVEEFPNLYFLSIDEYPSLHLLLKEMFPEGEVAPLDPLRRVYATAPYFAYLRISEGCDHFCSYCAIPFIRGRYKSRPYEEILAEARLLLEKGKKEIAIISQDPAAYGKDFKDGKPTFLDLLKALDEMGFYSIRLLYLYPSELGADFVDFVSKSKSIVPYFDIPVQSGSDHVLKLMHRTDKVEGNLKLIKDLKAAVPESYFRTTLIAGFPGETEEDVENTMAFLKEARFDHVGVFSYSREEKTAAYYMKDQIEEEDKERRRLLYLETAREISLELNRSRIGKVLEGIVIGKEDGKYFLRAAYNAPDDIDGDILFVSDTPLKEGEVVKVRIERAGPHRLIGARI